LRGAEWLGFAPAECLAIEDAPAGIQAARATGMKVIGMASTYEAEKLAGADAVVKAFSGIRVSSNGTGKLMVEV
jgi:sugar-phosphatase